MSIILQFDTRLLGYVLPGYVFPKLTKKIKFVVLVANPATCKIHIFGENNKREVISTILVHKGTSITSFLIAHGYHIAKLKYIYNEYIQKLNNAINV